MTSSPSPLSLLHSPDRGSEVGEGIFNPEGSGFGRRERCQCSFHLRCLLYLTQPVSALRGFLLRHGSFHIRLLEAGETIYETITLERQERVEKLLKHLGRANEYELVGVCWREVGRVSECAAALIFSLINALVPYDVLQHMDVLELIGFEC